MLMTSALLFVAMRKIWCWNLLSSALVAGGFLIIDTSFFIANLVKILDGGYIPLLLAAAVCTIMLIWHRGIEAASQAVNEKTVSVDEFFTTIRKKNIPRVSCSAVFLTRTRNNIPPVMRWHVARNRALQQKVLSLTIVVLNIPRVKPAERLVIIEQVPNYWHGTAQYGFMERPHIPELLRDIVGMNCPFELDDVTYYLGHETIVGREDGSGLPAWQRNSFAFMVRNCAHVTNYYHLPSNQVVEISRQIAI